MQEKTTKEKYPCFKDDSMESNAQLDIVNCAGG